MIEGYEKLRIPNTEKKEVTLEVNWSDSEDVQDCKLLRITFPGQPPVHVKKEHFHALMFTIGNPEEQKNLIPQSIIKKRRFEGLVQITATKDIKKGEKIITRCFHDLPEEVTSKVGPLPTVQDLSKL